MSLDIGTAFTEGFSRTLAKNGLLLAAIFAVIALLTAILTQTLIVSGAEAMLSFFEGLSPDELEMDEAQYEQAMAELQEGVEQAHETAPLAVGLSPGVAAGGLLVLALVAEAASIVAVRTFASDETDTIPGDFVTDNILLATLNGFIGGIIVWALIVVGLALFIIPGIFLAVVFYFLRQEIALNDKNFVQAMADSWRVTKGYRIEIFVVGLVLVIVSQLELIGSTVGDFFSPVAAVLVGAILGGLLTAFGAAVATRVYVQVAEDDEDEAPEDPYAAALGPDDLPQ